MATGLRSLVADENVVDKIQKFQASTGLKGTFLDKNKIQKRPALGELGNRAIIPNTNSLLNKIKEATQDKHLKNTKAKVDCFWKAADGTKLQRAESIKNINNAAHVNKNIAVPANKPALRSTTTNTKVNQTVHPTKTLIRDQKPAVVKVTRQVVKKESVSKATTNGSAKKEEVNILRREDSNLSRKSLTKLKAALAKDQVKRDGLVATKTENGIALRKRINKTAAAPTNDTKKELPIEKVKIKENVLPKKSNVQLKPKVCNIDVNDFDNLFAVSEYVNDIYKYLNELEETFRIEENFLRNQVEVTPRMRTVLLDWINEVSHQFRLHAETYQITVGIIDRYLQLVPTTTRQYLQLVGVTALFIATKYEELYSSDIEDFIYMTDNSYVKQQILEMERNIMKALDFQLSRPFPLQFLRRFSKAFSVDEIEHCLAKYILELTSLEYSLAHCKPSQMAAAALYTAVQLLNVQNRSKNNLWNATVEYYSGYSATQLEPLVKKIAIILKNAPKAKNKSIYMKFKTEKFHKISSRPELYGKLVDSIIEGKESNK